MAKTRKRHSFFHRHSLSIVASAVLLLWIVLYAYWDPETHWGSFFGNAIADWSGLVVMILATKYLYEKGSKESRQPSGNAALHRTLAAKLRQHSLTIALVITGLGWIYLFANMNPSAKWGQVVGNIVSEWTQILGVVLLTKSFIEVNSKE